MAGVARASWLAWPGPSSPLPSAFALLAVPARLGCWGRAELAQLLDRRLHVGSPPNLGWRVLSERGADERLGRAQGRRPETVRLGAELLRWWPPSLRLLGRWHDPTMFDRLRFCRTCLEQGDHSPLFQLPWWDGCPIHADPLCEGCPRCGAPIPAGLPPAHPADWLTCAQCRWELSDPAKLAKVHAPLTRADKDRWWSTLAAYRRWLRATNQVRWSLDWHIDGEGSFADVAHQAVQHLIAAVPVAPELARHLGGASPAIAAARAWTRTFVESPTRPRVQELGFASSDAMLQAGRRFYGALPIPESCRRVLSTCHRRLRRQLRVPLVGQGAPNGLPDADLYDWRGKRPLPVLAFRLLTGLARTDRVEGVAYLDFGAAELLLTAPANLAQIVLAKWTGVDLRDLRAWPADSALVVDHPRWMLSRRPRRKPEIGLEPVPRGAFGWLYERLIFETWHDLALECFSRAKPRGVMAWRVESALSSRSNRVRDVCVSIELPANVVGMSHPLLTRARADRARPRGWAMAVMQSLSKQGEDAFVAFMGRAAAMPFAPPVESSFEARWTWPEEMTDEPARPVNSRVTP